MKMVADPKVRDLSFLIPEGMTHGQKNKNRSLIIDRNKSSPYKSKTMKRNTIDSFDKSPLNFGSSLGRISSESSMRSDLKVKNQTLYDNGQNYRFKLNDLNKYSMTLKFKDMSKLLERSALGKVVPQDEERRKRLSKASYLNRLQKVLKKTDWEQTLIYQQYKRNGRWKHEDQSILSEIEIKYLQSSLTSMISNQNDKDFLANEGAMIIDKHFLRVMRTLEILMNQLNMMFYWERLRYYFLEHEPKIDDLHKLMSRILKLYQMIDHFMKIFKMMELKKVSFYFSFSHFF